MAFHSRDDGSVAVEYGLIAAFLVVIIIVALVQLRTSLIELPLPTLNSAFEEAQP
ncbi:MAG: Flp family type IVb pilin [Geminicoccaceae bacterium]